MKIAIRRNLLKKQGESFLSRIHDSLDPRGSRPELVTPEVSVDLERRMIRALDRRRRDGTLICKKDVDWPEISRSIHEFEDRLGRDIDVAIFLNNHMDFPIKANLKFLTSNLLNILEFDGDAIYTSSFNEPLVMLADRHDSSITGSHQYDLEYHLDNTNG